VPGNSSQEAAEEYKRSGQLAKDQKTVSDAKKLDPSNLQHMPDVADAQRRLDDYTAITDPDNKETSHIWYEHGAQREESQHLAGERLNDWNVATSTGPVAKDPILGGDMRDRAKARLTMQRQLQDAQLPWSQLPMLADEATKLMDNLEVRDRATALTRLQEQLQACGVPPDGAAKVVDGIVHGHVPQQYIDAASAASKAFEGGKDGVKAFAEALPTGRHWGPGVAFSEADVESFVKLGKHIGWAGSALELGVGLYEGQVEGKSPLEVASKSAGGLAGAWALGEPAAAAGGLLFGPPGAFAFGLTGATVGAFGGEWGGEKVYKFLKAD
jgi:hypothetical protein